MRRLVDEFIPHAPQHGLFVTPYIPEGKLYGALGDYATEVEPEAVRALYDATLLGSGKDGAVFTDEALTFQNNNLAAPQTIRYADIVGLKAKKQFLGGRKLLVDVNRGRATVTHEIDFAAKPDAAEFIERFLREAMVAQPLTAESKTDREAVTAALEGLVEQGLLSAADRRRMLDALG